MFKKDRRLIIQEIAAGVFHILHHFLTILLLLFIGQIIGQSDSAKSKILQLIFLGWFNPNHQWIWIFVILFLKFISTYFRNYYREYFPFRLTLTLQDFWLRQIPQPVYEKKDKEIKNYAKAYFKGKVLWWADLFLMAIIFSILFYLQKEFAFYWIIFWVVGIIFRWWVVTHYTNSKRDWRLAKSALARKWIFLLNHQHRLKIYQQWKKEGAILNNRKKKANQKFSAFAFQRSWTSAFFPVYFFGFILLVVGVFRSSTITEGIMLQLVLVIIYSQSALMRTFKVPEQWKVLNKIHIQWEKQLSQSEYQPESFHIDGDYSHLIKEINSGDELSDGNLKLLLNLFDSGANFSEEFYQVIFNKVTIFDLNTRIIGETWLSAILSDKESRQKPLLDDFIKSIGNQDWEKFPWKQQIENVHCNPTQLKWMHIFRALLHPGNFIIFRTNSDNKLTEIEEQIFLNLVVQQKKKIIYVEG